MSESSGVQHTGGAAGATGGPGESFSRMLNTESDGGTSESATVRSAILIVDDKPELLDSLYQLILLNGYEADKALGGEQALEALGRKHYDVVLLDLIMPGVSGHDVLDYAAREQLECKIIVVSGDSSFSGVKHALHCGAFDFVKKPYDGQYLVAAISQAMTQAVQD